MNHASPMVYIKNKNLKAPPNKAPIKQVGLGGKREEIKEEKKEKKLDLDNYSDQEMEIDTNVFAIEFDFLKNDKENIALGDPIMCTQCHAFLNKFSKIFSVSEYEKYLGGLQKQPEVKKEEINTDIIVQKQVEEKPHKDNFFDPKLLLENEKLWVCEFCSTHNKIRIQDEEIPKKQDVIYILPGQSDLFNNSQTIAPNSDISLIFCIDVSGSMSVTTEVKGKINLQHGLTQEELDMLKQFMEPGAENQQYYPGMKQNTTFVSRQQCVIAAIESQIQELAKQHPNRNVGLVTFNDEVIIIGDGTKEPVFIAGDKLHKYDEIMAISSGSAEKIQSVPVQDSAANLIKQFEKIQEKGQTALGPGLLAALGLASKGQPGSMVILCTDGLANVGLGAIDGNKIEDTNSFFTQTAQFAKDQGIAVSIVTIKGEGCKIEVLNKIVDETNGNVTRVNPEEIGKDFAAMLKDEVIATQVKLTVRLSKLLNFRNEDPIDLRESGSVYHKDIGNATVNTKLTFEYTTKSPDELAAMGIGQHMMDDLQGIPFQSQIEYTSLEGKRLLRVLTNFQKATDKRQIAEENVDARLLHKRVNQVSNAIMQKGDFQQANQINKKWNNYLVHNDQINSVQSNVQANIQFQQDNNCWRKAAGKKEQRLNVESLQMSEQIRQEPVQEEGFFDKIKKVFQNDSQPAPPPPAPSSSLYNNQNSVSIKSSVNSKNLYQEDIKMSKAPVNKYKQEQIAMNFSDHESYSSDQDKEEAMFQQRKKK